MWFLSKHGKPKPFFGSGDLMLKVVGLLQGGFKAVPHLMALIFAQFTALYILAD